MANFLSSFQLVAAQHIYYRVFSIIHENRTYRDPEISVHNKKYNFDLNSPNPIIYTKIINNIIMFHILRKYCNKMAMQLLSLYGMLYRYGITTL